MSETFKPRTELRAETKEARERYVRAKENLGKIAVESLTNRKANRIRNLGARMVAGSELRGYRKELAKDRKDRFQEAADGYKSQAKQAKEKIKFAKNGYGRMEKRDRIKTRATALQKEMITRDKAAGKHSDVGRGLFGKIGNKLETRALYKDAKEKARAMIESKEAEERAKLNEYQAQRAEALSLHAQAKNTRDTFRRPQGGINAIIKQRAEKIALTGDKVSDDRVKVQLERTAAKHAKMNKIDPTPPPPEVEMVDLGEMGYAPIEVTPPAPDVPMVELVNGELPHNTVVELHSSSPDVDDTAKAA